MQNLVNSLRPRSPIVAKDGFSANKHSPLSSKAAFSDYVYRLVSKRNPNRLVTKSSVHVVIHGNEEQDTLFLYPRLTQISHSLEIDARDDIEFAISLLENNECKHIYLLFPKTKIFKRQTSIKSQKLDDIGLDYTLKLIPYKMDQIKCVTSNLKHKEHKCA